MKIREYFDSLEEKIVDSYTTSISMEGSERLAGEFLRAQLLASKELKNLDLDSRMRKASVKSLRAVAYKEASTTSDKKPTESALEHVINSHPVVQKEQDEYDKSEANKSELERYLNIFQQAHHYYKGLSKGEY